ncbi:MAG: hypothetical protein CVU89_04595 [Firmicutes bacterium HGW-Firmicutes-14]|nr:MAG: hypothetical protein CVU89_04595 [Firmicutes bacterium HGW-Firmicutes-14]
MSDHYNLVIFLFLALIKGLVETYAGLHRGKGGEEGSKIISRFFVIMGLLTPALILLETVLLGHNLSLAICLTMGTTALLLFLLRAAAIKELGRFYSVNIRITEDHQLVKTGVYRYFRHPLYLIGILENVFYPMAAGAYWTAVLLVVTVTPVILLRRHREEGILLKKFGREYADYRKSTWF